MTNNNYNENLHFMTNNKKSNNVIISLGTNVYFFLLLIPGDVLGDCLGGWSGMSSSLSSESYVQCRIIHKTENIACIYDRLVSCSKAKQIY